MILIIIFLVIVVIIAFVWPKKPKPIPPEKLLRNLEYRPKEEWSPTLHGEIWGEGIWWKFKFYGFGVIKVPDYPHKDGPVFMTSEHWKQVLQAFNEVK